MSRYIRVARTQGKEILMNTTVRYCSPTVPIKNYNNKKLVKVMLATVVCRFEICFPRDLETKQCLGLSCPLLMSHSGRRHQILLLKVSDQTSNLKLGPE